MGKSKIEEALEEFHGLEFYEHADIKTTRGDKYCDVCGSTIPKGSSHLGYRFYGEDGNWPVFIVCNACEKSEAKDLGLIEDHKSD